MKYFVLLVIILFSPSCAKTIIPELPASFRATLPSASSQGIEYHLNLLPNKIFYLTTKYLDKPEGENRFDDIGIYSTKNKIFTLKGGREAPLFFEMTSRSTLRKLDLNGKVIQSTLNYDLQRDATFVPASPRLLLQGMYTHMADAGILQECRTGKILSVAQQLDNIQLERTYLDAQQKNNDSTLMAIVEGEIQQRPNMEGNLSTLIIHKFIRFEPKAKCKN
jgi:copper homeostasis protein (lipoprotein)